MRGTFNIDWPWRWLGTNRVGDYQVNESVQPTEDLGQHNPRIQSFQSGTLALTNVGTNTIVVPGLNRAAEVNPSTFPSPTSRGARRWLNLRLAISANLASGDNVQLTYAQPGTAPGGASALLNVLGSTVWPANVPIPLIGGATAPVSFSSTFVGKPYTTVYVPDPDFLFISILSLAGSETAVLTGLFLEADSIDQPLPAMFT